MLLTREQDDDHHCVVNDDHRHAIRDEPRHDPHRYGSCRYARLIASLPAGRDECRPRPPSCCPGRRGQEYIGFRGPGKWLLGSAGSGVQAGRARQVVYDVKETPPIALPGPAPRKL